MSAASRTIQATSGMRPVGAALLALAAILAVGALLAFGALAASKPQAGLAGTAPVVHDRGWSTAPAAGTAPVVHDRGSATAAERAAIDAGRNRPKTDTGAAPTIVVRGANGGGVVYMGIPYPAPGNAPAGASSIRVRLAR